MYGMQGLPIKNLLTKYKSATLNSSGDAGKVNYSRRDKKINNDNNNKTKTGIHTTWEYMYSDMI